MTIPDNSHAVEVRDSQAIQAGTGNAQYIYNYPTPATLTPATPAEPPTCLVVGEVPQRAPAFQPRPDLIDQLEASGPGIAVVRAVTGMRGVGKTQIAAAWVRARIDAHWRLVAWVNAADRAQILSGLAEIATKLRLGQPGEDLAQLGRAVRHWLEADGNQCLLVFDNADDLDFLTRVLPVAGQCQVLITSNLHKTAWLGTPVPVDVFTKAEAAEFLARRTGLADACDAGELAAELGYLPLALAQAAAVIAGQRLTYQAYLARLRGVSVQDYLRRVAGEPYPHGAAEAIILALDSVTASDPTGLSELILGLLSMLSATGVSRTMMHTAGQIGSLSRPTGTPAGADAVDEALGHLADASLLTFSVDGQTVTAHRLTMRVIRERTALDGTFMALASATATLLTSVDNALGESWQNRPATRDLVEQIAALHEHVKTRPDVQDQVLTRTIPELRRHAVWRLNELRDSAGQAIVVGQELLLDCEQILGSTHPNTLMSRNHLANAYHDAGRLDEAIALHESTLADCEQILGSTHPYTLMSRSSLAYAYRAAGRLDEAIALYKRTLTDREQTLGSTHPDTLTTRNGLAAAYLAAGRLDEAIALHERTLTDREQILGSTHPDTLTTRNDVATAYLAAGRLDEAIALHERTLTDYEQILGSTHPYTLTSRNNLAHAYRSAGRLDEAIALHERTLTDYEQILGSTHPDTLTSRNNLAHAYRSAGRLDEAIALHERTLTDREQILGSTHPDTLNSRNGLAAAYRAAGRVDQARALLNNDDDVGREP